MTGQISTLPLELVAVVVAASMLAGAVDILRQPGWAWKQAEESKPAYLILDLLLPVIGLAMYAFRARPKVIAAAAAGESPVRADEPEEATTEPTTEPTTEVAKEPKTEVAKEPKTEVAKEPKTEVATEPKERITPVVTPEASPFTSFREVAGNGHGPRPVPAAEEREQYEVSGTFFSTGASNRTLRHPLALARAYRPRQRTSLVEDQPGPEPVPQPEPVPERALEPQPEPMARRESAVADQAPTVSSGWKVDPTGRHEFRYWDGTYWTENVADEGQESLDAVSA